MKNHFGVYAVIVEGNKILLVEKTRGPYAGLLDLPGGRLEPGESLEEALVREVKEETGLQIEEWEFLRAFSYVIPGLEHSGKLYTVTRYNDRLLDMSIQHEDVKGAVWRSQKDLDRLTPIARLAVNPVRGVDQHPSR